jgi:Dyp-type peroxidase family
MHKMNYRPLEPVLPLGEIQGIVVPGFLKPHQTLVGVRFPQGSQNILKVKRFLARIAGDVSTAEQTLLDRRRHRIIPRDSQQGSEFVMLAVAVSYSGLCKLTASASAMSSEAFRAGLLARSLLLGDRHAGPGSVARWEVGGPGKELDGLFVVAGDDRAKVSRRAEGLVRDAGSAAIEILYDENGDDRSDFPGREHFGFHDGISQPGIRGRATDKEDDYITPRHIVSNQAPEAYLFGYPGQDLVWPGVFVLGQPGPSPDPLIPGIPTPALPNWTSNGSFLVFRRLVQDVGLFWRTMRRLARDLSKKRGFEGIDDKWLASRLVGRWQSGAPVNRVPKGDDLDLGRSQYANNHFRFDSDSGKLQIESGYEDKFPMSIADPAGMTCPWAAHIRKVNTRDSGSDTGGRDSTYLRRLLRVGVPFGPPLKNHYAGKNQDVNFCKRGLLFLSIQASIEDQFEFLVARWMGDPSRPKMPGGHDILTGQNDAPGEKRVRRCVLFGSNARQAEIRIDAQWIIPTGGGYFFVPSISALRDVLGG